MTGSMDGASFGGLYPATQRASLDRSGSFRGSGGGPSTPRNPSPSKETMLLSQQLSFDLFPTWEHKNSRTGDIRRALGIPADEHSSGSVQNKPISIITSEELKRIKGGTIDAANKARDRGKMLGEKIEKVDKLRSISRSRQRNDAQPNEKPGGSNLFKKTGNQLLSSPSDNASFRSEDKGKNCAPNKRARSSLSEAEGRASIPVRQDKSVLLEKDRAILWACNGVATPMEDKIRGLPAGAEGWDKKMKRKRSVGTMISRIPEGDRDCKPSVQQRSANESHSRNNDGLGFRSGSSSGMNTSINSKADNNSQITVTGSRVPRNDLDVAVPTSDRRDRPLLLDKERSIAKGNMRLNMNEETQGGSQGSLTKGKASRQPRTGSTALINSCFDFPRPLGGIDGREQPPGVNKIMPLPGTINQKRTLPTGSSSPPVTQWVVQRPQKISRTRRQRVVSPVSNFDENLNLSDGYAAPDPGSRVSSLDPAGLLSRGLPNSTQQLKLKLDNTPSPAMLLEGEDSGAVEIFKTKDKEIENGELEDGILNTGHKIATIVLPTKKNKAPVKDKIGDGVRRQGRSGRSSVQPKAGPPLTNEKPDSVEINKPGRIGRSCSDKNESRIGRPSKKGSDRKTSIRPIQAINNASEFMGESDDDYEEMLAAANAARSVHYDACSSSFWKAMDPYFSCVSSHDVDNLRSQINFVEDLDRSFQDTFGVDLYGEIAQRAAPSTPHSLISMENNYNQQFSMNPKGLMDNPYVDDMQLVQGVPKRLKTERSIPLSQRLLSSFIVEDAIENYDSSAEEVDKFLHIPNEEFRCCSNNLLIESGHKEKNNAKPGFKLESDFNNQKISTRKNFLSNGFAPSSTLLSSSPQNEEVMHVPINENIPSHASRGNFSECCQTNSVLLQDDAGLCGTSPGDSQYEQLSLDEKILMELKSIDICPDIMPDIAVRKDEVALKIEELKTMLYRQMKKKKQQFQILERRVLEARPTEENNFLGIAMDKLVEASYKKLTAGGRSHSHKSGASKIAKQAAAAFAKRTLIRCQKFKKTGETRFSKPPLRDVIFSPLPGENDGTTPGANSEPHINPPSSSKPTGTLKGKRAERDRDASARTKAPVSGGGRGERKMKTKPKQKTAQLTTASGSGGILGRGGGGETSNRTASTRTESCVTANNRSSFRLNQEATTCRGPAAADLPKEDVHDDDSAAATLTNLPLDSIDELGDVGPNGQGQDLASWLNVEDDMLPDDNLIGLEIPMDDLSELKFF